MDEMKSLRDQLKSVQAACRTARTQDSGKHWEVITALITVLGSLVDSQQRQAERLHAIESALRDYQSRS